MLNLNYYGLSKENYKRVVPDIRAATSRMSKNTSRVFFLFMFVLFFVSLIGDNLQGITYIYLSLAVVFLIISILSFFKFFEKYGTIFMYLECLLIYTFAILVANSHPAVKSTQIFIFMILLPILFGDESYRVGLMSLLGMGAYLIVLFVCLDKSIWFSEALNAICLTLAGIIAHFFVNKDRCLSYLARLEKEDVIVIEKETQNKFQKLSEIDSLTGVFNRRKLFDDLDQVMKNGDKKPSAIFMVDVDSFKQVNDNFGHIVGDSYLRQFGEVLLTAEKEYGVVCYRYGGDEFIVLAYSPEESKILESAEKIKEKAKKINVAKDLVVSISIGVAPWENIDAKASNLDSWIVEADEAVYKAKKNGHDQVVVYSKDI